MIKIFIIYDGDFMAGKRENCISWDTLWMLNALHAKNRSKDPGTQVGAVIVKDNHLLSLGYNGAPKGMDDDDMPWESNGEKTGNILDIKNTFVVHAEANALIQFTGSKKELNDSILYVTLFPCNECAKLIASSGVKEVVYLNEYRHTDKVEATKRIFDCANIKYRKLENIKEIIEELDIQKNYLNSLKQEKSL